MEEAALQGLGHAVSGASWHPKTQNRSPTGKEAPRLVFQEKPVSEPPVPWSPLVSALCRSVLGSWGAAVTQWWSPSGFLFCHHEEYACVPRVSESL